MARYTGPRAKIARKFSDSIYGAMKAVTRKPYPPGQHGKNRRRKQSEYAKQLNEKQKAKYTYGILEKQFANTFKKASAKSGITGNLLLQMLETRLDNIIFRIGIAPTRRAARQLVSHKHITVNGKIVNIPSYQVKIDDLVGVREKSKSLEIIANSLALQRVNKFPWLQWNEIDYNGRLAEIPNTDEIPEKIETQLIVELYSK